MKGIEYLLYMKKTGRETHYLFVFLSTNARVTLQVERIGQKLPSWVIQTEHDTTVSYNTLGKTKLDDDLHWWGYLYSTSQHYTRDTHALWSTAGGESKNEGQVHTCVLQNTRVQGFNLYGKIYTECTGMYPIPGLIYFNSVTYRQWEAVLVALCCIILKWQKWNITGLKRLTRCIHQHRTVIHINRSFKGGFSKRKKISFFLGRFIFKI